MSSPTGYTTSSLAMVTRAVPTTPKCPTRSQLWTSTTPSCPWTTCIRLSQITPSKSQKKTLNYRFPHSGMTQSYSYTHALFRSHPHFGFWFILNYCIKYLFCLFFSCFSRITFPISNKTDKGKKRKADYEGDAEKEEEKTLIVEPYVTPNRGPYPYNQPKRWVT